MHVVQNSRRPLKPAGDAGVQPVGPESFDLLELLRKLWRRKGLILGTIVTLMVIAFLAIQQLTPHYTATALVEINPPQSNVVDIQSVLGGLTADAQTLETQVRIISSRTLARRTVERLELTRDPEFNGSLRRPSTISDIQTSIGESFSGLLVGLGLAAEAEEASDPLVDERLAEIEMDRVIDVFLNHLEVAPEGRSRILSVSFESEDPEKAAEVANTLSDYYIVAQLEAKFDATKRANDWLNERIAKLRGEVEQAEQTVEAFRDRYGLVRGQSESGLTAEQISDLSTQLVLERTKRVEAEARLNQVERLLDSPSRIETASDVLASPLINDLRIQETQVERQIAELSQEFGSRHPKMLTRRAELKDLRTKIRAEVNKIVQGLRNEVAVARARESSLTAALEKLKKKVAHLNSYEVQLRALEREAAASRTLLETLLARSKETASQEDFQQADANVLSHAGIPQFPSYPKKGILLAAAFVGALLLGVMLAFAVEQMDRGFRSKQQIERLMGATALGLVPILKGMARLGKKPEDYILDKPTSAYGESIRSLHTNLLLSDAKKRPKVVLFASSGPKEGKTTVAVSMARMLASVGQKVMLIDCDLRRPAAHKSIGLDDKPGLTECLTGELMIEQVIQVDERSGAQFVAAGAPVAHPTNLLSSEALRRLLAAFSQRYDIVILDSAPVIAVSDSLILSRLADKTVYLVRWATTPRETAMTGLQSLVEAGADMAGVLLTQVDAKEHAQYGFGDSGTYTGEIKKYYTS